MKIFKISALILAVLFVIISILFFVDKTQIKNQNDEISELEGKVHSLETKVSDLESEKEELESKISQLSAVDYHQSLSLKTHSDNRQSVSGGGYAVVVYKQSSCDYFILMNLSGYIVAEWMGDNDPAQGDKITGNFNSFGTKNFYNQSRDRDCRLWIDDYMLSKESAMEKIRDKCN